MSYTKSFKFAVALAALVAAGHANAVTINFSFSSDLSDSSASNNVTGTITGRIVGLVDNATSSATALFIDTYPAAALGTISNPAYATPLNVAGWSTSINSFTLAGGTLTAGVFQSNQTGPGGFDQFYFNVALVYANGNTNYFNLGNNNSNSIWNNNGLAGIQFGGAVPEPATWGLLISGFAMTGLAVRRRRARVAA